MIIKPNIQFQILIALTALFVLLMAISFRNCYNTWQFIFLLLSLASLSAIFILHRKTSDKTPIEDIIKQRVEEERIKLLSELNKNKEEEESLIDNKEEIDAQINKIIPKGKFSNIEAFAKKLLSNLAREMELAQGIFYIADPKKKTYSYLSGYAITSDKVVPDFKLGEDLTGEAAQTQELMVIDEIPENYFDIESGLGSSRPKSLLIMPIVDKKKTIGLLELAIFIEVQEKHKKIISAIAKPVAAKFLQIQKS